MKIRNLAALVICACAAVPMAAHAAPLLSDDFDTAGSASNYNTFITAGATGASGDVRFGFDYAAAANGLFVPSAPHSTGGSTVGVAIRTDNLQSSVGTVVGASAIATKNLNLPSVFKLSVDVWGNYIGGSTTTGIAASGSNGTSGIAVGIGTSGTALQYVAANDGLLVEGFPDNGGGANQAYRTYTNNVHPNPTTATYWSAGTSASSATFSDPYYASFAPATGAPASQASAALTQSGTTPVGVLGFAWHTMTITGDGTNYIWAVDGKTITTVPYSAVTLGGKNISLGNDDTGLSGNSTAANQLYNVMIFDNLVITPEPTTLSLLGLGGAMLVRRRK